MPTLTTVSKLVWHLKSWLDRMNKLHEWSVNTLRPIKTRTTRTPAFWGYPPPPHDYPYHWVILDPKSKEDKVKVTNLKKFAKISNFWILKRALHTTHHLKLLNKMCKYEMDSMSIVEYTERTRFCPPTDSRTDGQGDTSIPPFQLRWNGGYKKARDYEEISITFS